MPRPTKPLIAITIGLTAAGGLAAPARAEPPVDDLAIARCEPLDGRSLAVGLSPGGELLLVYANDAVATCNEAIVVSSYASAGPSVDNHADPLLDQIVLDVAELEAAGSTGVTVEPVLDRCWAGLQVHRDGDTLLWEHVEGNGCEPSIDVLSADPSHPVAKPCTCRPNDDLDSKYLDDDVPAGSTVGGAVRSLRVPGRRGQRASTARR